MPVIVTDLPVYNEIGLNDLNSIKLKQTFTKDDIDTDLLFKKYKFKYEPPTSEWNEILAPGKNTWQDERKKRYKVKPTPFFCAETPNKKYSYELGRQPKSNDIFEVSHDRLQELIYDNEYEQPLVEVIDEIYN